MNSGAKLAKTPPKSGFYSTTIFPGTRACQSRETGILEITFSREIPGREIPGREIPGANTKQQQTMLRQMLHVTIRFPKAISAF